jgi:transcriptional regulator with XRE-family HTH domain
VNHQIISAYGFNRETCVLCLLHKDEDTSVPESRYGQLGKYIHERRSALGMSLRDLESLSGLSRGALSQIEKGLRGAKPEKLQRIAEALRVDYEDLYAVSGIPRPEKLPELDAYLRTRYRDELTATDRRSLERYFVELRDKKRGKA